MSLPGPSTPVTITYLEMHRPLEPKRPCPAPGLTVRYIPEPTVRFYRYLYGAVGGPWHWLARRDLADHDLAALIAPGRAEIHVLFIDEVPSGFAELAFRDADVVDLRYFGLMEEAIGRGVGAWFLERAVILAWRRPGTLRVRVDTCTLDHPRALPLYQCVGFVPYATRATSVGELFPALGSGTSSTNPS